MKALVSGDSDYSMYVPSGQDERSDIMLWNIKVDHRCGAVITCSTVTGQSSALSFIEKAIGSNIDHGGVVFLENSSPAAIPAKLCFDGVQDPLMHIQVGSKVAGQLQQWKSLLIQETSLIYEKSWP